MANLRTNTQVRQGRSVYLIAAIALMFALRSLVPAGFMPDQALMSEGKLRIEICGPDGVSYAYLNLSSEQSPQRGQHTTTAFSCIFCVLSAQGLMSGSSADHLKIVTPVLSELLVLQHYEPIPVQNVGPPMGPRAPPYTI